MTLLIEETDALGAIMTVVFVLGVALFAYLIGRKVEKRKHKK